MLVPTHGADLVLYNGVLYIHVEWLPAAEHKEQSLYNKSWPEPTAQQKAHHTPAALCNFAATTCQLTHNHTAGNAVGRQAALNTMRRTPPMIKQLPQAQLLLLLSSHPAASQTSLLPAAAAHCQGTPQNPGLLPPLHRLYCQLRLYCLYCL
jgi:hypothetical protein